MFYALPPAGQPINLRAGARAGQSPADVFHPWQAKFFNSGTAALAAAVMAAVRLKGVHDPQVILPAYGCPDLVSAVLYAGASPVLVDLEPERPWMDLDQLAARVGPDTVAIIAVDLFGIQERLRAIRAVTARFSPVLIEDSAQAFPVEGMEAFWGGDLVVVSFGRGKPVSLLGGGAVLYRENRFDGLLPDFGAHRDASAPQRLAFRIQAVLYNLMSRPRIYWIPAGLPFLHLGETRFHALAEVRCMDAARLGLLTANIHAFRQRGQHVQTSLAGRVGTLARTGRVVDLPAVCDMPGSNVLLRYPLLFAPDIRDRLYNCMKEKGLGVSRLYPAALPDITGLGRYLAGAGDFPVARAFARRLLTLPVHSRVRDADITAIWTCM